MLAGRLRISSWSGRSSRRRTTSRCSRSSRSSGAEVQLVIVGSGGWKNEQILQALRGHPYLHASLIWRDDVSDGELSGLYRDAVALIQASDAEGFGLPIIESLSLGTPVLANDIPVFQELAGAHATFFDIHREGELGGKVEQLLREGVRSADFAWPTWRERVEVLFEELLVHSRGVVPERRQERTVPEAVSA